MVLVKVGVPPEQVQVIRSNIGSESAEKCGDVQWADCLSWPDRIKKCTALILLFVLSYVLYSSSFIWLCYLQYFYIVIMSNLN
jgi:hypothetical protein